MRIPQVVESLADSRISFWRCSLPARVTTSSSVPASDLLHRLSSRHSFHHAFPFVPTMSHPSSADNVLQQRLPEWSASCVSVPCGVQLVLSVISDWDPTKWIIYFLHVYTPLVPLIARTPESAIKKAKAHVHRAHADRLDASVPPEERIRKLEELPVWSRAEIRKRHGEWVQGDNGRRRRVLLLLEGCIVDAGGYLNEHVSSPTRTKLTVQPGGAHLLLSHCVSPLPAARSYTAPSPDTDDSCPSSPLMVSVYSPASSESKLELTPMSSVSGSDNEAPTDKELRDATRSFFGGMNNHSGAARERMRCMRVARLGD